MIGIVVVTATDTVRNISGSVSITLLADARHGRRPSFIDAAPPAEAERLFALFVEMARASGVRVATGRFQEHMQVEIYNDGPVTIMLDSREKIAD